MIYELYKQLREEDIFKPMGRDEMGPDAQKELDRQEEERRLIDDFDRKEEGTSRFIHQLEEELGFTDTRMEDEPVYTILRNPETGMTIFVDPFSIADVPFGYESLMDYNFHLVVIDDEDVAKAIEEFPGDMYPNTDMTKEEVLRSLQHDSLASVIEEIPREKFVKEGTPSYSAQEILHKVSSALPESNNFSTTTEA